jgi:hypothetical protein
VVRRHHIAREMRPAAAAALPAWRGIRPWKRKEKTADSTSTTGFGTEDGIVVRPSLDGRITIHRQQQQMNGSPGEDGQLPRKRSRVYSNGAQSDSEGLSPVQKVAPSGAFCSNLQFK